MAYIYRGILYTYKDTYGVAIKVMVKQNPGVRAVKNGLLYIVDLQWPFQKSKSLNPHNSFIQTRGTKWPAHNAYEHRWRRLTSKFAAVVTVRLSATAPGADTVGFLVAIVRIM